MVFRSLPVDNDNEERSDIMSKDLGRGLQVVTIDQCMFGQGRALGGTGARPLLDGSQRRFESIVRWPLTSE